mmetsp:Transcript_28171/g.59028  ORF Transcript_28171/g.59028 Transcript_28171/m.59028 type:complete len:81 (-) Transcript_28171:52-294(-)
MFCRTLAFISLIKSSSSSSLFLFPSPCWQRPTSALYTHLQMRQYLPIGGLRLDNDNNDDDGGLRMYTEQHCMCTAWGLRR